MSWIGGNRNNLTDKTPDWGFMFAAVLVLLIESGINAGIFSITVVFLTGFFVGKGLIYSGMSFIGSEIVTEILFGVIFVIIKLLSPIKYK